MHHVGLSNVVDLTVTFNRECARLTEVEDDLANLARLPVPVLDVVKLFGKDQLPKLAKRKIILGYTVLEWKFHRQQDLADAQSRIDQMAQEVFFGGVDVVIEGLLEEEDDSSYYFDLTESEKVPNNFF